MLSCDIWSLHLLWQIN